MPILTENAAHTTKGPYRAHRERQRSRIMAAAQKVFDARGIDRVLMGDIVEKAGIRASTLYEYFASKDEIVWALVEQVIARSQAAMQEKVEAVAGSSALACIAALLDAFREELLQRPEDVRFMAQFDAMYARDWTVERLLVLEDKISPGGFHSLSSLIRKGIADGSVRVDLDPDLTLHAILNAMIGTQRRLASLGNRLEQEYQKPIHALFDETVRIVLLGLRVPG